MIDSYNPGQRVTLTVKRGGQTKQIVVTLGTPPADGAERRVAAIHSLAPAARSASGLACRAAHESAGSGFGPR